ncbi:MAG: hypothetical protein F6K31_25220 [Symploca sp. SIO2G7]|nr:hypothetical protein [Symploca sp. SIO2G7]
MTIDEQETQYWPLTPVYSRDEVAGDSLNFSEALLPEKPLPPDSVYQMIKNDLLMDAQPGLNLATFCNEAYTDPWGAKIVSESVKKNFIDYTEYPGTILTEKRSIRMIARELGTDFDGDKFNGKEPTDAHEESQQGFYGTATIGSSEAIMLGLIAHKFIWNFKHRVLLKYGDEINAGATNPIKVDPLDRPVVLMSSQVHGCWDKFCRYYDAVPLYVECKDSPYSLHDASIITEILNTKIEDTTSPYAQKIRTAMGYKEGSQGDRIIGELAMTVGACIGTTFTGNSDNVPAMDNATDEFCNQQNNKYTEEQKSKFEEKYKEEYALLYPEQKQPPTRIPELIDIPLHVDAAASSFVLMFSSNESAIKFNFKDCPKRVLSINLSNHKFGMTFTGMGSVIFKHSQVVDPSLIYNIPYLGGNFENYTVNFSRGSAMIVMQYYNFLRFGREGYRDIMDKCVENTRWFVEKLQNDSTLKKYFKNVSNFTMGDTTTHTIDLPTIALTWADGVNSSNVWHLTDISDKLAQKGWVVPAYRIPVYSPEDTDGIEVLRIVVQQVVTREKLKALLKDMKAVVKEMKKQWQVFDKGLDKVFNKKLGKPELKVVKSKTQEAIKSQAHKVINSKKAQKPTARRTSCLC